MAAGSPAPSMMVVVSLSIVIFFAWPRSSSVDGVEPDPEILGDGAAVGQDRKVFEHGFPPIAIARCFHRCDLDRAPELVDDERRERFALDVLRNDEQRTAGARHQFQQRQEVLHRADLLLVDQDEWIDRGRLPCARDRSRNTARDSRGRTAFPRRSRARSRASCLLRR